MCSKYDSLKAFYETLTNPCLNDGQKRSILLKLRKRQRLGIAELIINVLIGNLNISDETRELLTNYSEQMRFIARQGKDITNQQLARHSKAVTQALKIALERLEKESENRGADHSTTDTSNITTASGKEDSVKKD
jgi:hypothetical protein